MKPILLDIMEKGRFLCQLKYLAKGRMEIIDGKPIMAYDLRDIRRFVFEQRPSLKGKDINICFSNSRV